MYSRSTEGFPHRDGHGKFGIALRVARVVCVSDIGIVAVDPIRLNTRLWARQDNPPVTYSCEESMARGERGGKESLQGAQLLVGSV